MFCQNCGFNNDNNSKFCQGCGAPVIMPGNQAIAQSGSNNSIIGVLKKIFASPLFLITIIAYSCGVLFEFIHSIAGGSELLSQIYTLASYLGDAGSIMYELSPYLSAISGTSIITAIIGLIPEILVITALWLIYATAINRSNVMKTTGFTIIKVVNIIYLIGICLAGVIIEVVLIILTIGFANSYLSSATGIMVVAMIVWAIIVAVCILVYAKIVKTINAIVTTIKDGDTSKKASAFLGVYLIIMASFNIISFLGSLFGYITFWSIMNQLCMIVATMCFGIFTFKYNRAIKSSGSVIASPVAPVNPVPVVNRSAQSEVDTVLLTPNNVQPAVKKESIPQVKITNAKPDNIPQSKVTSVTPKVAPKPTAVNDKQDISQRVKMAQQKQMDSKPAATPTPVAPKVQAAPQAKKPASSDGYMVCAKCGNTFKASYGVCPKCGYYEQ